ncbi:MAG: OmpA family protein [Rubrivivax sp.]|nr:OmpA family protein [Rubrivivax sp.]
MAPRLVLGGIAAAAALALVGCNAFSPGAHRPAAGDDTLTSAMRDTAGLAVAPAAPAVPVAASDVTAAVPMQYLVEQRQEGSRATFALCLAGGCEAPTVKTLATPAAATALRGMPDATAATAAVDGLATTHPVQSGPLPMLQTVPASAEAAPRPQVVEAPDAPPPRLLPMAAAPEYGVQRAFITFELAKPSLTAEASARLEVLRPLLRRAQRIKVTGFTDDLGAQAYNDDLAHARARATLIRLRELIGENDAQLSAGGRGLCCYAVANTSGANRAQNRRAELELIVPDDEQTRRLVAGLARHLGAPSWQAASLPAAVAAVPAVPRATPGASAMSSRTQRATPTPAIAFVRHAPGSASSAPAAASAAAARP